MLRNRQAQSQSGNTGLSHSQDTPVISPWPPSHPSTIFRFTKGLGKDRVEPSVCAESSFAPFSPGSVHYCPETGNGVCPGEDRDRE
jgi:hypothetical protein